MKRLLAKDSPKTVIVQRPVRRNIRIEPGSTSLGLKLIFQPERSTCLKISGFQEGRVPEFNKTAPADQQVAEGDFVEVVNGKSGEAKAVNQALMERTVPIELTLLRLAASSA